jgi:hypothetical protein
MVSYSGVGAFRNTVMTNTFESSDASKDSFARSLPPAAAASSDKDASPRSAMSSRNVMLATGAAAVVAGGAFWLWRRKSRGEELDETPT